MEGEDKSPPIPKSVFYVLTSAVLFTGFALGATRRVSSSAGHPDALKLATRALLYGTAACVGGASVGTLVVGKALDVTDVRVDAEFY